ncbi:MAG: hypothetical protein WCS90_02780 [Bacilli bacterium]
MKGKSRAGADSFSFPLIRQEEQSEGRQTCQKISEKAPKRRNMERSKNQTRELIPETGSQIGAFIPKCYLPSDFFKDCSILKLSRNIVIIMKNPRHAINSTRRQKALSFPANRHLQNDEGEEGWQNNQKSFRLAQKQNQFEDKSSFLHREFADFDYWSDKSRQIPKSRKRR